ncbi:helix-turn-helix domain-containing protein [Algoriphagus aquimarinus]|uniref:AraC-type DNA-binding protein n=1 Tax=Algoriphagus aquimarinus TaxID=237018 RepID=A0A1I1BUF9_9BACT|nr:helix-turn-helix domain-containing protein [Algoriphagus aquimarinus]SFB53462.1 AraC-type DNA-binding protein [Algoriphagus aquimarinus]
MRSERLYFGNGFLAFIFFFFYSCLQKDNPDIVLEDFEDGSYLNKWEIQGTAFNAPINIDSIPEKIFNVHGKYFAYSAFIDSGSFRGVGKLISNRFTINRKFLSFLIAGHQHETRSSVNLIIDNTIVRTATGKDDLLLREVVWDIDKYQGKEAYLEIVDALAPDSENGFDNRVLVDHLVLSDKKVDRITVFEDFESGTFNNWQVIGEAFSEPNSRTKVYYPLSANGYKGNYYAFSFGEKQDARQGKLVSSPFKIEYDKIQFLIGGGSHEGETCVNLLIDGRVARSATGDDDGNLRLKEWDVSNFKGEMATIEIVDHHSGSWGHIMVDEIVFFNKPWWQEVAILAGVIFVIILISSVLIFFQIRNRPKKEISDTDRIKLEELKDQIIVDQAFLNHKYNSKMCSESVGIDADRIEQLFLAGEGKSFLEFINELRVEEFKKELNDPKNKAYTMIYIANQCGFSSKTSFYRIFKEVTKITPTDYKKQL